MALPAHWLGAVSSSGLWVSSACVCKMLTSFEKSRLGLYVHNELLISHFFSGEVAATFCFVVQSYSQCVFTSMNVGFWVRDYV